LHPKNQVFFQIFQKNIAQTFFCFFVRVAQKIRQKSPYLSRKTDSGGKVGEKMQAFAPISLKIKKNS
jgi:hypothetical protein